MFDLTFRHWVVYDTIHVDKQYTMHNENRTEIVPQERDTRRESIAEGEAGGMPAA